MPDLLLELFCEEIPARMQPRAEADLARLMTDALTLRGLAPGSAKTSSGPRRIAFFASDLATQSQAVVEERKGPRVGAPDKAIEGFLRAAGVRRIEDAQIVKDPKGDYYLARIERPGKTAHAIIAEVAPEVVRAFPWPKSMRWGSGSLRWVRPLHSVLCLFNDEPVLFEIDGIKSGNVTYGHRFLGNKKVTDQKSVTISHAADYASVLLHAKVVVTRDQRASIILEGARKLAWDAGLALVEDHGLLDENAGLAEWPVVLSGQFDESYLDVPDEILMTAMRTHQKYFSLRRPESGRLANRFILVANLEAEDGGKAIIAGNERVIRARLSDARFFWTNDVTRPLDSLVPMLGEVTFHEKLGTQLERVQRIRRLAKELAPLVKADADKADEAALLAKADLMSQTVGEFPELQGIIGQHIANAQGRDRAVAAAIAEHYKPQGPNDPAPTHPVSIAVALADKLDMLTGFWAIDEKPTGSKDPYALRRAALGVIRIVLENQLRMRLIAIFQSAWSHFTPEAENTVEWQGRKVEGRLINLLEFFAERLKVHLRDKGARHDLIDAVFSLPGQDDLLMIVRRVEALGRFLATEDGQSLLALVRRALNILKIEEKKDGHAYDPKPVAKLLKEREEKALSAGIKAVSKEVATALRTENFEAAMAALSKLRAPVDNFFDKVTVNVEEAEIRENRLKLLAQIRALTSDIADFSKIEA